MQVTWVWYSFLYWISPTFSNHLKFRWYHYKFCKGRAEVFRMQLYLGEWKLEIERTLAKNPKAIIPSHGYVAILKMIEDQEIQKIVTFLESDDFQKGMAVFIKELNNLKNTTLDYLETLPIPNRNDLGLKKDTLNIPHSQEEISLNSSASLEEKPDTDKKNISLPNSEQINARTYVIATQIYYELYQSPEEIYELKKYTQQYVKTIRRLFRVHNLPDNISKLKNFDYVKTLNEKTASRKGQLRRQLEQITNNPLVFGEDIAKHAEGLIKQYF